MESYQIIIGIVEYPNSKKFYKELRDYYNQNNFVNETKALDYLIEKRFNKNDGTNITNCDKK